MAQRNLPTASVRDPRGSPDEPDHTRTRSAGARDRNYKERIDALEREVEALEAKLERRDDRLQSVIDRYEAVLVDKRREYERRLDGTDARRESGTTSLHERLHRLLARD